MRKVRHLRSSDFVLPLKQRGGGVITASCESVVKLERVWSTEHLGEMGIEMHGAFDADAFDGISLMARLVKNGRYLSSVNGEFTLNLVDTATWLETEIKSQSSSAVVGIHTLDIPYADILPTELSGAEVFSVQFKCQRGRKFYRKKIYLNHLGVFENVIMLRRAIEANSILKADE